MYQLHKLDHELSERVYKQCKEIVIEKRCYVNIYKLMTFNNRNMAKLLSGAWKIAYGFIPIDKTYMVRHSFFVDETGCVIDPTRYTSERHLDIDDTYVSFKIFDKFQDYIVAVDVNDDNPDLFLYLQELEDNFRRSQWADNNKKVLLSHVATY